jgi:DNA-3-methyladenine glycosylase I
MNDAGIIRNRLKINAAIENAKAILQLQKEHGSFEKWLQLNHPKTKEEWVKLFKKTFRFTGGEIVNEFLLSIGYLPEHIQKIALFIKNPEGKTNVAEEIVKRLNAFIETAFETIVITCNSNVSGQLS